MIDWILFAMIACFWGGSFIAIKNIVETTPPVFGAALRVVAAIMTMTVAYGFMGKPFTVPRALRARTKYQAAARITVS